MKAIEKLLSAARAEIGYVEKATSAQLDDKTANPGNKDWNKYAAYLDGLGDVYNGKKNGYAWCDIFVDYLFLHTFGRDAGMAMTGQATKGLGAGCTYSARYYKDMGRFFADDPQPGDQIFFTRDGGKTMYHTGIVERVAGGRVYTIEGNTSSAPGVVPNGGMVRDKSYALNYSKIGGYGRPDFSVAEAGQATEPDNGLDKLTNCEGSGDNPSDWAREATEFCKRKGIFAGDGNGNYGWKQPITREAVAQVIYNLLTVSGLANQLPNIRS